jgi:hypothetical protein
MAMNKILGVPVLLALAAGPAVAQQNAQNPDRPWALYAIKRNGACVLKRTTPEFELSYEMAKNNIDSFISVSSSAWTLRAPRQYRGTLQADKVTREVKIKVLSKHSISFKVPKDRAFESAARESQGLTIKSALTFGPTGRETRDLWLPFDRGEQAMNLLSDCRIAYRKILQRTPR